MEAESVEVLIIAGDIFHHSQPSASAQAAYYKFLTRCTALPTLRQIVVVGGNHDSASRLDAPGDVLKFLNVHTIGGITADKETWERCLCPIYNPKTKAVEAVVAAVPFVQEARLGILTTKFDEVEINKQYELAFQELYTHLADLSNERYGNDIPLIATGHLTCAEKDWQRMSSSDFNSDIHQVGTIGALPLSIFDERYDYVALGHIHHARQLGTRNVWYSGTPVATRPEESTTRQVLIAEFDDQSNATVTEVEIPTWRRIITIQDTPDGVLDQLRDLKTDPETEYAPYIYIDLLVDKPTNRSPSDYEDFLKENTPEGQLLPRILKLSQTLSEESRIENTTSTTQHPSSQDISIEDAFTLLYGLRHQTTPDQDIMIAFRSILTDDGQADLVELEAVHKEHA